MNFTNRTLRAFGIAAIPLIFIASAAVAANSHPAVLDTPAPSAMTSPGSSQTAVPTKDVDATGSAEPTKDVDATKTPEPNESSESSKAPQASDTDGDRGLQTNSPDKDGDRGVEPSKAPDKDGDRGSGSSPNPGESASATNKS